MVLRLTWKISNRLTGPSRLLIHVAMILCLLLVSKIRAEPIRIENSGFELPNLPDGSFTSNDIPSWVLRANDDFQMGVWNPDTDLAAGALSEGAFEGQNVAYHNSGTISQTLRETLAPNMTYTLTVQQNLSLVGSTEGTWEVALLAGNRRLVSLSDTVASLERDNFVLRTLQHTTDSSVAPGQPLRIRMRLNGPGDVTDVVWDDVTLDAVAFVDGDFDNSGELDVGDIDMLVSAIRNAEADSEFDTNDDGLVNQNDLEFFIETKLDTWFGDANLDGEFNTRDLVSVFVAGEYEDATPLNSTWATGDWNGDGDFTSRDFVSAFQGGGFEQGPREAVNAVPEPSSLLLLFTGLTAATGRQRRNQPWSFH